jgi:hypothetical protein
MERERQLPVDPGFVLINNFHSLMRDSDPHSLEGAVLSAEYLVEQHKADPGIEERLLTHTRNARACQANLATLEENKDDMKALSHKLFSWELNYLLKAERSLAFFALAEYKVETMPVVSRETFGSDIYRTLTDHGVLERARIFGRALPDYTHRLLKKDDPTQNELNAIDAGLSILKENTFNPVKRIELLLDKRRFKKLVTRSAPVQ